MQERNTNSFPNEPVKPAAPRPAGEESFKPRQTGSQPFSGTVQRTSSVPPVVSKPASEDLEQKEEKSEVKKDEKFEGQKGTELMISEDRQQYEANMESRLKELGAKIDDFIEKAENAKEQAVCKFKELKEKQEHAATKLQCLKDQSVEAWGEFKHGMDNAFEELSKAWEEIKSGSSRAASKFEK